MRKTVALLSSLTALVIAGCAGGGAKPMRSSEFNINLDVSGTPGSYTCAWSGGGGNGGDVTVPGPRNNPADVKVHLKHGSGTSFDIRTGSVDLNNQVSFQGLDTHKHVATFHDINSQATTGSGVYYKLTINDNSTSPATPFDCDPKIINN